MKIIVDAMGGDNAPLEIVKGALAGQKHWGVDIVLTGDENAIREALTRCGQPEVPAGMEIISTSQTVEMCDDPATVFRRKKDTSMGVGLTMLREGQGDALVSAGSTGALLTGATLITKRIHGIRRAAMAPVIPTTTGQAVLIDCGANAECTPEYLVQFAYLGNFYAQQVLGLAKPRVGLLNIGAEDSKGTDLQKQTLARLRQAAEEGHLHFIGNNILYSPDVGIYEDTPKTATSDRWVSLPTETTQLLRQYRVWQSMERLRLGAYYQDQDFLFTQDDGRPMHPDSVTDWLAKFSKRHGLPHINPTPSATQWPPCCTSTAWTAYPFPSDWVTHRSAPPQISMPM